MIATKKNLFAAIKVCLSKLLVHLPQKSPNIATKIINNDNEKTRVCSIFINILEKCEKHDL